MVKGNVMKKNKQQKFKHVTNGLNSKLKKKPKLVKKPKLIDESDGDRSDDDRNVIKMNNKKHKPKQEKESIIDDLEESEDEGSDIEANDAAENSDDEINSEDEAENHKMALDRLKETDPDFYEYLQQNDKKLLNFNLSDDEDEDAGKDEVEDALHKPSGELEVASDESDFEPDDDEAKEPDERVLTLKQIKQWQSDILTDKTNKTIGLLIKAFEAALKRVSDNDEETQYKVEGSSVFNAVIQLCVLELGPAIRRYLGIKSSSKQPPHKCKKFGKIKTGLKDYFTNLLQLLGGVTSSNILNVLLKHLHYISPMLVSFPTINKPFVKKLIDLWSTSGDEGVRVVAFLCVLRLTHSNRQSLLDYSLRAMYMAYVKNSRFVSAATLPAINFMRRSLVEMFSLDMAVSYQHVFLYIRQLAINLRNAVTVNKKENVQAIYNWQYVNSLRLWGNLLAATCNKPQLQPLVYPFVQVCLGTVRLVSTAQYYPLRFHVTQILIELSRDTRVFIPVLPFILEVLTNYDFNKKHQKVTMKPIDFTSVLRMSKSQLVENGFKDALIEHIYGQTLEHLAAHSDSIAFPDMVLICCIQIKTFTKKCKNPNYQRKMQQLLEKIEQNRTFVESERKKVSFQLSEHKLIDSWETKLRNAGTPLSTFFESWNKIRNIKKSKRATNNEEIGDYNLPELKKRKQKQTDEDDDDDEEVEKEVELFPSDSEDEEVTTEVKKTKRGKRGAKKVKKVTEEEVQALRTNDAISDEVKDFNLNDW